MNLLNNLFNASSLIDLFILKYSLFFSLLFLLPYFSVLLGSILFSLIQISKGKIFLKIEYLKFAEFLSDLVMKKKWMMFFLGIVPFIVLTFSFNNLFLQSYIGLLGLTTSFTLFIFGIFFISVFRRGFLSLSNNNLNKGTNEILSMFGSFRIKAGWFGLFFLVISSYLLIVSLQASIVPNSFENISILSSLFSANSIIYFLLFISIVFSITSAVVIARMNRTNQNYLFKEYAKEFANRTGMLFTLILPLLFILNVFTVEVSVLSFSYFLTSLFILLLMLTISVQFYSDYTNNKYKSTSIVFIFLLLFSFVIYNSQITTENASKKESIKAGRYLNIFS